MIFLWKLVVFSLVLGVLIAIHELGHFLVAKWCRIGVLRFSIGFGPSLLKWKRGETTYSIGIIPLGGYVRMVGDLPDLITNASEYDPDSPEYVKEMMELAGEPDTPEARKLFADRSRWFVTQGLLSRTAVVLGGPIGNFILAFVIVAASLITFGDMRFSEEPIIGHISSGSPAERAGLKPGDLVTAINSEQILTWEALAKKVYASGGAELKFDFKRLPSPGTNASEYESAAVNSLSVVPQLQTLSSPDGTKKDLYLVGLGPSTYIVSSGVFESISVAAKWVWHQSRDTLLGVGAMVSGNLPLKDLASPIFIFHQAADQAERGIERLLMFVALLSVSLGVLNLLPVPVLDGGHLVFFLIEAVVGPLNGKMRGYAQQAGMLLLLGLMVVAVHNDLTRSTAQQNGEFAWKQEK